MTTKLYKAKRVQQQGVEVCGYDESIKKARGKQVGFRILMA